MLSEREAQLREINARVAAYKAMPNVADMKTTRFEKEAMARATDLLGMFRRSPAEARKALEKVLTGPLMFTPIRTQEGQRFQVTGQAGLGSVFGISITGVPKGIRTSKQDPEQPNSSANVPGANEAGYTSEAPNPAKSDEAITASDRPVGSDPVEVALADAINRAARAEAWATVEALTAELRARRADRAGVVSLEAERAKRGGR